MKFDFDNIVPRRGSGSVKWDLAKEDGVIPMWVADMDFMTAPAVLEALEKRLRHGVFGYTRITGEYYRAVCSWFSRRHGLEMKPEWIIPISGVVPALTCIIRALVKPGEKVIFQSPAYNCFYTSVTKNGCTLSLNPLTYKDNTYTIDFEDLERRAADPDARVLILCNPHNPSGRVWTREELARTGEICLRNHLTVIADEIHCELTGPGHEYIPFASLSEEFLMNSVTCTSPSKAFNIAGLEIANITAADSSVREKIREAVSLCEQDNINSFGPAALIAAYDHGEEWLDELLRYIHGNYRHLLSFAADRLPGYDILPLEGTYLAWMNISRSGMKSDMLAEAILKEGKVMVNPGTMYGPGGEDFIRINLACPRKLLDEGLRRIAGVLDKLPKG